MECERLPAPRTWDHALPEDRKEYRIHVRFCQHCRARVLKEAPDQLLFDVQNEPLPEEFWYGFWNSIRRKRFVHDPAGTNSVSTGIHAVIRWAAVFLIGFLVALQNYELPDAQRITTAPIPVRMNLPQTSYPVIENIGNPEARYYIFQSGEKEKIVMVFDPEMEL
jgi:hypothetical protein